MLFDQETILFLKVAIEKDGFLELPADGNSMFPLIQRGDVCRFNPCSPGSLVKGDIILFHTDQGQLIAHRLISKEANKYLFKGDTNLGSDLPATPEQIIGKLTTIKKQRYDVSMQYSSVKLWGNLIMSLPFLSGILRKYLNWKSHYAEMWSTLWRKLNSL
ncbi:S24/S26 family peptidase [Bacillus sp. ISL-35]|uniref:S24/S26 family peptidase n=1 Tax=Bacillus sp. ISL-35 TaxID=2819122 RepID=UPI001BEC6F7D|nr:S24/S26 family peptidase [Bacillus sp. ISL-35]MBT2679808.1 S24/S26 family peptidase [Bacillus sp. ISL-35]MBT2704842.1 S24/S26 family peptidase [Chryseobacterium sp. ISL-80]